MVIAPIEIRRSPSRSEAHRLGLSFSSSLVAPHRLMRGGRRVAYTAAPDRGGGRDADGAEPLILMARRLASFRHLSLPGLGRNDDPVGIAGEQPL
jgi:hypothetical protein